MQKFKTLLVVVATVTTVFTLNWFSGDHKHLAEHGIGGIIELAGSITTDEHGIGG